MLLEKIKDKIKDTVANNVFKNGILESTLDNYRLIKGKYYSDKDQIINIYDYHLIPKRKDVQRIGLSGGKYPASHGKLLRLIFDFLPKIRNIINTVKQGFQETSHPEAKKSGRRTFHNPKTGETLEFDKGKYKTSFTKKPWIPRRSYYKNKII